jgi:hypothetical protein
MEKHAWLLTIVSTVSLFVLTEGAPRIPGGFLISAATSLPAISDYKTMLIDSRVFLVSRSSPEA